MEKAAPVIRAAFGLSVAEAAGEVEEGQGARGIAAGILLGEFAGERIHLLAEQL